MGIAQDLARDLNPSLDDIFKSNRSDLTKEALTDLIIEKYEALRDNEPLDPRTDQALPLFNETCTDINETIKDILGINYFLLVQKLQEDPGHSNESVIAQSFLNAYSKRNRFFEPIKLEQLKDDRSIRGHIGSRSDQNQASRAAFEAPVEVGLILAHRHSQLQNFLETKVYLEQIGFSKDVINEIYTEATRENLDYISKGLQALHPHTDEISQEILNPAGKESVDTFIKSTVEELSSISSTDDVEHLKDEAFKQFSIHVILDKVNYDQQQHLDPLEKPDQKIVEQIRKDYRTYIEQLEQHHETVEMLIEEQEENIDPPYNKADPKTQRAYNTFQLNGVLNQINTQIIECNKVLEQGIRDPSDPKQIAAFFLNKRHQLKEHMSSLAQGYKSIQENVKQPKDVRSLFAKLLGNLRDAFSFIFGKSEYTKTKEAFQSTKTKVEDLKADLEHDAVPSRGPGR